MTTEPNLLYSLVTMSGRLECEACGFDASYPVTSDGWSSVALEDASEHGATVEAFMTLACKQCKWHCEFAMDIQRDESSRSYELTVPDYAATTFWDHLTAHHVQHAVRPLNRTFSYP